ncbi:MAG: bile acid:sodium symporter family protein [Kordiimonadaceae bacterium]|nr:bile acid:sodium symporter family protein [Kordiimonadaceae bacterium]
MQSSLLTDAIIPLTLALMMVCMGLSLRLADFKRVFAAPKAAIVGLICQMIGLPILGFLVAVFFELSPDYAAGTMILVFCAGGVVSGLITQAAGGDVALSVSMTVVSMVVGVVTIPVLVNASQLYFLDQAAVELDLLSNSIRLLFMTVVPVGIGMLVRHRFPVGSEKMRPRLTTLSNIALAVIILVILFDNLDTFIGELNGLLLTISALNWAAMALGFAAAKITRLDRAKSLTLMIEVGFQNSATGIFIAATLLGSFEQALPSVIYSGAAFINVAIVIALVRLAARRNITQKEPAQ